MALKMFKSPRLSQPPQTYEASYFNQLVRAITQYFTQLDSFTPNQAESFTAEYFYTEGYGTAANLPTAADYKGARTFVTDAAAAPVFGAVVTGGGALFIPCFSDGTNWRNG